MRKQRQSFSRGKIGNILFYQRPLCTNGAIQNPDGTCDTMADDILLGQLFTERDDSGKPAF